MAALWSKNLSARDWNPSMATDITGQSGTRRIMSASGAAARGFRMVDHLERSLDFRGLSRP